MSLTAAPDGDAIVLTRREGLRRGGRRGRPLPRDGPHRRRAHAGDRSRRRRRRHRHAWAQHRPGAALSDRSASTACAFPRRQLSATSVARLPRWSTSSRSRSRCSAPRPSAPPTACSSSPSSTRRIATRSAGRSLRSRRSSTGLPTCSCGSSSRSRSATRRRKAVDGQGHEDPARLVSVAKAYVADRCLDLIDDCVQINGGIGVTWEHDIHIYSRRVAVEPGGVRLARRAQGAALRAPRSLRRI